MSKEIEGVPLSKLEDPIRNALQTYQQASYGLGFDADRACKLISTPDKSTSARSETGVVFRGGQIGNLYVIAFKPRDGTGSEVNYKLENLVIDPPYPRDVRVIPRDKTGIHTEAHMVLVSHATEDVHSEPRLYAGTFDLLGLEGNIVKKIGRLGHLENEEIPVPVVTLTVGYIGAERFGDPHAVFSAISAVQVCAFLAISYKVFQDYRFVLEGLRFQYPAKEK